MDQCDQKSLEDKETDAFLDEVHKRKVSDEIKQRNKLLRELANQNVTSGLSCDTIISTAEKYSKYVSGKFWA